MPPTKSVQTRLIQVLTGIACVAVLGVLAILPYRLYQRDIRHATVQAHRISSVVHTALARAVLEGEDVTDLVNRFQGIADLEIRLSKLGDGEVHPAATSRKGSSELEGTDLTYTAPPILDREGNTWLASMYFDLSSMKRESIRLIIDLCLVVVIGSALFSLLVFVFVRRMLVVPLRDVTRRVEQIEPGKELGPMPDFHSPEMTDLARAIEKACRAHGSAIP
jgi:hypothetical protein